MRDVIEMIEICVVYTDSFVTGNYDEYMTDWINCELARSVELSVIWSVTSYRSNKSHVNERELTNSMIPAADIHYSRV